MTKEDDEEVKNFWATKQYKNPKQKYDQQDFLKFLGNQTTSKFKTEYDQEEEE